MSDSENPLGYFSQIVNAPRLSPKSLSYISALEGAGFDFSNKDDKLLSWALVLFLEFNFLDESLRESVLALPSSRKIASFLNGVNESIIIFMIFASGLTEIDEGIKKTINEYSILIEKLKEEIKRDVEEWNNAHYPAGAIAAT